MASDPTSTLHFSRVVIRPAATGWSILVSLGFLLVAAVNSRISYGFILILLGAAFIDSLLTYRGLIGREIEVAPLTLVAEAPDQIALAISVEPGIPLSILPHPFSPLDGPAEVADHVHLGAGEVIAQPVHFSNGALPSVRRHLQFRQTASALGLVQIQRTVVYIGAQFFHRIPEIYDLIDPVRAVSIDEVGRLRDYVPGDRRSRVSWLATARTGSLHVRDTLVQEEDEVVVVAQLATPDDLLSPEVLLDKLTESTTAIASVVANLLDQGIRVTLRTMEVDESVHTWIEEQLEEDPSRQNPILPEGFNASVHVVEREVSDRNELIRRVAHAEVGIVPAPRGPYIEVSSEGIRAIS